MKKILSIIFSIVLIFSMSVPAFARVSSDSSGAILIWDRNTDGLDTFVDGDFTLYRVCDTVDFTSDEFFSGYYTVYDIVDFNHRTVPINSLENLSFEYPILVGDLGVPNVYIPFMIVFEDVITDEFTLYEGIYYPYLAYAERDGVFIDYRYYIDYLYIPGFTGFKPYAPDEPVVPDTPPSSDTIVVKEDRPFFTTPLDEYTVTEGLLLLLFVITFLNNIFKQHLKGN